MRERGVVHSGAKRLEGCAGVCECVRMCAWRESEQISAIFLFFGS